ncbi:MAG: serine hydrolase [Verrucomicrobiae bacterium]|nr:serine hydrolase [Verrucomicrobiae bacterium]
MAMHQLLRPTTKRFIETCALILMGIGILLQSVPAEPLPGQIVADADGPGFLRRHLGRPVFICGPGDPEGFLYRGSLRDDGTREGDQLKLIRRLLEHGGNCLYIQAVRSHGGDGTNDHNPFVNHDPSLGVNLAVLEQWESWFTLLDNHGILIYLFFYDDSSDPWKSGDDVSELEAEFIRTMVQKFQHHRNLIWVVAEESEEALSPVRAEKLATLIRAEDKHQHLIGNHHHSGTQFKSYRPDTAFDHFSMQLNVAPEEVYMETRAALEAAGKHYQLIYAENTETPPSTDAWRHHAWAVAMAGASPMMLGMDVASTPDDALRQCRILSDFFEDTDFQQMQPALRSPNSNTPYVLTNPSKSFIAWSENVEDSMQLTELVGGNYELTWLDCQTGRRVERDEIVSEETFEFSKPASIGSECALYGQRVTRPVGKAGTAVVFPDKEWESRTPAELGLDKEKLMAFQRLAGGRGCIVKDGYLVSSWGDIARRGDLASASKPVYAHFLFRALEMGKLESADDLVSHYRPCITDLNPNLQFKDRTLTFRHLAFQTANLGYSESPGNAFDYNDHTMGLYWDVIVNDVLETPWSQAPALFERELAKPLQLQDGISFPMEGRTRGRPSMSPRDFARFGWLYLNGGRWKRQQIIAERHAELATRDPLPLSIPRTNGMETERCATRSIGGGGNQADHSGGYSWLWWLNEQARDGQLWWMGAPGDMYGALGHCGQRGIAILPTQRMVVSWNDGNQLHCDRMLVHCGGSSRYSISDATC